MTVKGNNEIKLSDVLVGEVWICSGQSNMAMTVNSSNDADLERAAESVGKKQFPLRTEDVFTFAKRLGLKIKWFDNSVFKAKGESCVVLISNAER